MSAFGLFRDPSRWRASLDDGVISQPLGTMIVLVDPSVWIRFLSNRAPHAAELAALLSRDEVSGHAALLLASALVARLRLWTTDPALATVAKELGVACES